MDNLIGLIHACHLARENPNFQPRDGKTFCNFAVEFVSRKFGYDGFTGLRANDIMDKLRSDVEWLQIDEKEAQHKANKGQLVIAGWRNPAGHPGHVAIVVPGRFAKSAKWNSETVPRVLNIGKDVFIGKGANWAFDDRPLYFSWEGS